MAIETNLIQEINLLAKKQKEGTLTSDDKIKQIELRQKYLEQFRNNVKRKLDNITVVEKFKINVKINENQVEKLLEVDGIEQISNEEILYDPKKVNEKIIMEKINEHS